MAKRQAEVAIWDARSEDYPFLCDVLAMQYGEMLKPEVLEARDATVNASWSRRRLVLGLNDGTRVGMATIMRIPTWKPGKVDVQIIVMPEFRRRGIGTTVAHWLADRAHEMEAKVLQVMTRDSDEESIRYVHSFGAVFDMSLFDLELDLASFDFAPFGSLITGLEDSGYRFFALGSVFEEETAKRAFHDVVTSTDRDVPGEEDDEPRSYEEFAETTYTSYWFWPGGTTIAEKDGAWVGYSMVGPMVEGSVTSLGTGVRREHRGKGLATALKALSLNAAKLAGYPMARTENATTNIGMLRVNERFGYQVVRGNTWWSVPLPLTKKELSDETQ